MGAGEAMAFTIERLRQTVSHLCRTHQFRKHAARSRRDSIRTENLDLGGNKLVNFATHPSSVIKIDEPEEDQDEREAQGEQLCPGPRFGHDRTRFDLESPISK